MLRLVTIVVWLFAATLNCSIIHAQLQEQQEGIGELKNGVLHITAIEAAKLLEKDSNIKVLDVRTEFEYNRGHLEGAVQINYYWFGFRQKLAALDKEATWLVHCKSGVRSSKTLALMQEAGFKSIVHMDDGIDGWRDAQLPESITN